MPVTCKTLEKKVTTGKIVVIQTDKQKYLLPDPIQSAMCFFAITILWDPSVVGIMLGFNSNHGATPTSWTKQNGLRGNLNKVSQSLHPKETKDVRLSAKSKSNLWESYCSPKTGIKMPSRQNFKPRCLSARCLCGLNCHKFDQNERLCWMPIMTLEIYIAKDNINKVI